MKTAEPKNTSVATVQKANLPFFSKEMEGSFFGESVNKEPSFFKTPSQYSINGNGTLQTKLTIGEPNDKYEQEADAMADKVVQRLATPDVLTKKDTTVQTKPIATPITPFVQAKCTTCEQEDKLQKKEEEDLVLESPLELQRKPIFESNAKPPDDENNIQRKCAACEQEEKLQKKSDSSDSPSASSSIESSLNSSKGSGSPIPESTREQMESSFGADFSNVRLHTDSSAVQMNKDLHAQAFTHGSDIYFNSGKYDTNSTGGKHLLAHELTHTVQQGLVENKIQRVSGGCPPNPINLELIPDVMSTNGWSNGAAVLRQWFHNHVGGGPTDTSTITMSWIRSFARANTIYNSIFTDKLYATDGAKTEIIRLLTRLGIQNGQSFNFSLPVTDLDPTYYINHKVVDSVSSGTVDDLTATLGNFDFRVLVAGDISTGGLVTLTDIGVYAADSFDFSGFQYLGCWNTCTDVGNTDVICDGERVYNSDFRNWRASHGRGGDYKIYSDIETTHLSPPETFILNRTNEFTSTFEISARLVSHRRFSVSNGGGVTVTISNCDYILPSRNATPTDRIGIYLYKEGFLLDSEIGEKILRADITDTAVWRGLDSGNYYIAITFNSAPVNPYESVEGDISVDTFN